MTVESKYKLWLGNVKETDLKSELLEIRDNQSEKHERFYKDL